MLADICLLKIVEADGTVVAEAPLVSDNPLRALQIINEIVPRELSLGIDPRTILEYMANQRDEDAPFRSFTALMVTAKEAA